MGCFNYVHVDCPSCGEIVEFQSKSGSCELERYHISDLPVIELEGIIGRIEACPYCGSVVMINYPDHIPRMDFSNLVTREKWVW